MKKTVLNSAIVAAMATMAGMAQTADSFAASGYQAGDFHNHTTCTDGSTSTKVLANKSLSYLDWFIDVGHSGSGNRGFAGIMLRPEARNGRSDTF